MATYLPDAIDIFPQFKAYRPDFNSVERGLMLSDAAYEQGARKLRSMYDSIFSSALQRKDTTEKRDAYLKQISGALKSIASSDLSQIQNTDAAYKLFDPISSDPLLAKDIVFSRSLSSEYSKAMNLLNSTDPATRRQYWDDGIKALEYQAEEFRNATSEEALSKGNPRYVSNIDFIALADKMAKDSGLSVKQDNVGGGYIWSRKNGEIAYPLTQSMVDTMLSADPAVMNWLKTKAYVQRKDFVKQNALKYGSEQGAESAYIDKILKGIAKKNEQGAVLDNKELSDLKTQKESWDNLIRTKGIATEDDRNKYLALVDKIKLAEEAAKNSQNNIATQQVGDMKDLVSLRNAADNAFIIANYSVLGESLAKYMAFKNSEVSIKSDPVFLANLRGQLSKELENLRQANRKELEGIKAANRINEIITRAQNKDEKEKDEDLTAKCFEPCPEGQERDDSCNCVDIEEEN
jgi:hypothetical protein